MQVDQALDPELFLRLAADPEEIVDRHFERRYQCPLIEKCGKNSASYTHP
jgi:hypothetical protein